MNDLDGSAVGQQFVDLFFAPELTRRLESKIIQPGFVVSVAQYLQGDKGERIVRFNEEVRGIVKLKSSTSMKKEVAETPNDLEDIENFELIDEELDYGHATMIYTSKGWFIAFNFLSGRSKAAKLVDRAERFRRTGAHALSIGHADVAIDTLFSACELVSRAHAVIHSLQGSTAKTHETVASSINRERKMGNINSEFVDLFNFLGRSRHLARYEVSDREVPALPGDCLDLIDGQIKRLRRGWNRLPPVDKARPDGLEEHFGGGVILEEVSQIVGPLVP